MGTKNNDWLQDKIGDIKKRKRALRHIQDSGLVKKMKKDLKKEYRSAKHSEKNEMKKWLKEEIKKTEEEYGKVVGKC